MSTITDFNESFLPLEKMKQLLPEAKKSYAQAKPFPHIYFDDFFDKDAIKFFLKNFLMKKHIKIILHILVL